MSVGVEVPVIVIIKVLFYVGHSVNTRALTMSFWWTVVVTNPNETVLLVKFLKLMISPVYKNDPKTFPEVD